MANINLVAIAVAGLAGFVVAVLVAAVVCRRLLAKEYVSGTYTLVTDSQCGRLTEMRRHQ